MKLTIAILLTFCISCNYTSKPSNVKKMEHLDKISCISFHLEHSRRIPNNKVDIELDKSSDGISLHAVSLVKDGHSGWESTSFDTVYKIRREIFDNVLLSIRQISSEDFEFSSDIGFDGTTCEIRFGDFQNYIS